MLITNSILTWPSKHELDSCQTAKNNINSSLASDMNFKKKI